MSKLTPWYSIKLIMDDGKWEYNFCIGDCSTKELMTIISRDDVPRIIKRYILDATSKFNKYMEDTYHTSDKINATVFIKQINTVVVYRKHKLIYTKEHTDDTSDIFRKKTFTKTVSKIIISDFIECLDVYRRIATEQVLDINDFSYLNSNKRSVLPCTD